MKNLIKIIISILIFITCVLLSCCSKEFALAKVIRGGANYDIVTNRSEEEKVQKELYTAVSRSCSGFSNNLEELLLRGVDPNYCIGECGWEEANPLNIVTLSFYDSWVRQDLGESIQKPFPDVKTLQILLDFGADINRRPYIWDRVYEWNNDIIKNIKNQDQIVGFVQDSNRLVKALLEAGADPDMLGHPFPYSYNAMLGLTDTEANGYFKNGTRAINEAIKKGMNWERQVDLLLQYTDLDEKSLRAAKLSGDYEMVQKINTLWEKQQIEQN